MRRPDTSVPVVSGVIFSVPPVVTVMAYTMNVTNFVILDVLFWSVVPSLLFLLAYRGASKNGIIPSTTICFSFPFTG
jgi:hypothetical protein